MPTHSSSTATYYLEMRDERAFRRRERPPGFGVVMVQPPDPRLNGEFYRAVGMRWKWTDRLRWSSGDWESYVCRDVLITHIGRSEGVDVGYFELECQDDGDVEIVYLGLLPEYIGKGLGGALLTAALECAWKLPGARRVWLHTCTHDHPHALGNYLDRGFDIFRTQGE